MGSGIHQICIGVDAIIALLIRRMELKVNVH
jgi:hypothetical protein